MTPSFRQGAGEEALGSSRHKSQSDATGSCAVSFAACPLGSLFFARFGDQTGRNGVMIVTLFLMETVTF